MSDDALCSPNRTNNNNNYLVKVSLRKTRKPTNMHTTKNKRISNFAYNPKCSNKSRMKNQTKKHKTNFRIGQNGYWCRFSSLFRR